MSIVYVGQHEFAFATDSETLGTYGISTCLGIVSHNCKTKKTLLMHIDTRTHIVDVVRLLEKVNGQVHIVGTSMHHYKVLISYLKTKYEVVLDIKDELSRNVSVDSKTGEINVDKIEVDDLKYHSKYKTNQLELSYLTNENMSPVKLLSIEGYDDNYVHSSEYTPTENILYDKDKESRALPIIEKGYCEECKRTVEHCHDFICSKAIKCVECGQRTDLGLNTIHNPVCSQYNSDSDVHINKQTKGLKLNKKKFDELEKELNSMGIFSGQYTK